MIRSSAIRHLACSASSARIAAGFFERTVQIWDILRLERIAQFETVLTFGGRALALDPAGQQCITAGHSDSNEGIVSYEVASGTLNWQRRDLAGGGNLRFARSGDELWCSVGLDSIKLDPTTGGTIEIVAGFQDVFHSPYSKSLFKEPKKGNYELQDFEMYSIPRLTFAVLDASFSPDALCISESGGPVRCFDVSTGKERWRYDPGISQHMLRLWYRSVDGSFYGVLWEYQKGSFRTLARLDGATGRYSHICHLQSWEEEVCKPLDCLFTSHGELISFDNGRVLAKMNFPQTDYPDQMRDKKLPRV